MLKQLALSSVLLVLVCLTTAPTQLLADDAATPPTTVETTATEAPPAADETQEVTDEAEANAEFVWTDKHEFDYTINTLIMFICAVLVLFMQAGFAMVEVGLNSQKNTVNILFKNVMDLCIGSLLFLVLGYGLMYPGGDYAGKWFGFGSSFVTRDAQANDDGGWDTPPNVNDDGDATWSSSADFLFQVAFAATAATIVSGAVAGRMHFIGYLVYSAILTGLIYPISGMWKWGGGIAGAENFQDFAGSIVVHAVGGFAGLAGALLLGPRIGRFTADGKSKPMPGHNLTFAALGVFILWVGWYGFNPGSQLTYAGATNAETTVYIGLTTTFSAAAGAISAMILGWVLFGKPDLTMALNGALAGLVGITANCDRVSQPESIIIGAIAGILVVLAIIALEKLCIDDPVGAFPVHGVCGVWGGLATGIFGDLPDGVETQGAFFMIQLKWTVIICLWAFLTMFAVFSALKAIGLLRVTEEDEMQGLDFSEHGMAAYTMS
ncbi:MAG: ammonium transporter [Planctomycetaceae bacterium]|nr:ammonium transporter [Planctomycetaceae bacterium]